MPDGFFVVARYCCVCAACMLNDVLDSSFRFEFFLIYNILHCVFSLLYFAISNGTRFKIRSFLWDFLVQISVYFRFKYSFFFSPSKILQCMRNMPVKQHCRYRRTDTRFVWFNLYFFIFQYMVVCVLSAIQCISQRRPVSRIRPFMKLCSADFRFI